LSHTPLHELKNRQRILTALIPIEMIFGIFPTSIIATNYGFSEYYELGQAIQRGDVHQFQVLMNTHRITFIHHGVYLVLEQTRMLVYRNLFRRVFVILDKNTRINLVHYQIALQTTGEELSMEEIECLLANLIYQNRIKGYISHEKKFLILSKADPFPNIIVKYSS
jgi:nuclear mRNA export protein PCID2/THP1